MSRIGRKPIPVPDGVEIQVSPTSVTVKGPKGTLSERINPDMTVSVEDGTLTVARPSDRGEHRALHGLTRSRLAPYLSVTTSVSWDSPRDTVKSSM